MALRKRMSTSRWWRDLIEKLQRKSSHKCAVVSEAEGRRIDGTGDSSNNQQPWFYLIVFSFVDTHGNVFGFRKCCVMRESESLQSFAARNLATLVAKDCKIPCPCGCELASETAVHEDANAEDAEDANATAMSTSRALG